MVGSEVSIGEFSVNRRGVFSALRCRRSHGFGVLSDIHWHIRGHGIKTNMKCSLGDCKGLWLGDRVEGQSTTSTRLELLTYFLGIECTNHGYCRACDFLKDLTALSLMLVKGVYRVNQLKRPDAALLRETLGVFLFLCLDVELAHTEELYFLI